MKNLTPAIVVQKQGNSVLIETPARDRNTSHLKKGFNEDPNESGIPNKEFQLNKLVFQLKKTTLGCISISLTTNDCWVVDQAQMEDDERIE